MHRAALRLLLAFLWAGFVAGNAHAEEADGSLLDRVRKLNETTRRWGDRTQELDLRIVDRRGAERKRSLVIHLKKYPEDRNRSIVFFKSPPEVKNVSFMQWADPHGKDEQWLYLPAMKRVRKISGAARQESFVGTDFTYDDLAIMSQVTDWTGEDAVATAAQAQDLDGVSCEFIDLRPTGKDLSYEKIRVWFRAADLVILRYEMFDDQDEQRKLLTMDDIRNVGAIPTAHSMVMKNLRTGSYTEATFSSIRYDNGVEDRMFSKRSMERGR
jgi:hypothetical protein